MEMFCHAMRDNHILANVANLSEECITLLSYGFLEPFVLYQGLPLVPVLLFD